MPQKPELTSTTPTPLGADAALAALSAWMQPMAELALRAGLGHASVDEAWRMAMVAAAQRPNATRNTSQVSVATGLHRKEVLRLHALNEAKEKGEQLAPRKRPWASQVLLRWADAVRDKPNTAVLPLLSDDPDLPCFAKLARSVTTDVHPRAVLEELLRLGLVSEEADRVSLLVAQFVPKGSLEDGLSVLSDNVRDHLLTGLHNLSAAPNKRVEQAIWGEGLSLADAEKINQVAREAWSQAHQRLYQQICDAPEAAGVASSDPRHRIRVGMYVSVVETFDSAASVPTPKSTPKPTPKKSPKKMQP